MKVLPFYQQTYDAKPIQCMSLACQTQGHCAPIGQTNSMPPMPIYPPDCSTGARVDPRGLGNDAHGWRQPPNFGNDMASPIGTPATTTTGGQESSASSAAPFNLGDFFGSMSTTTLLLLGGAAYFFFFRKGR